MPLLHSSHNTANLYNLIYSQPQVTRQSIRQSLWNKAALDLPEFQYRPAVPDILLPDVQWVKHEMLISWPAPAMLSYLLTVIFYPIFYRQTLSELLEASDVPIITPVDITYPQKAAPYNLRLPFRPEAIAVPETIKQIQAAIKCAHKTNTKVAVRSGGHSYASHSLGGASGSLVIDISSFSSVTIDPHTNIATVGAGTRLGNLATELWKQGKRACPHGSCPGVGISGHSLLGGFGYPSRMWGLALDCIISLSAVLADSSLVTASAVENPELYWAFRGAGPSFGVVTELKLRTYPAPVCNIVYAYTYSCLDADVLTRAFMAVKRFAQAGPPVELGVGVEVRSRGNFTVRGVYFGTQKEFRVVTGALISELDDIYGSAEEVQINEMSWLDSLHSMTEGKPMVITRGEYNEHDYFVRILIMSDSWCKEINIIQFAKSIVESDADPLTDDNIFSLFAYLVNEGEISEYTWFIVINLYGGLNSAVVQPPPPTSPLSTSCYGHRDCLFVFQLYASRDGGADTDGLVAFVEGMVVALVGDNGESRFGGYPGYIDPTLDVKRAHGMYYGDAYPRLKEIKKRVDPKGLFWNPLAIGES